MMVSYRRQPRTPLTPRHAQHMATTYYSVVPSSGNFVALRNAYFGLFGKDSGGQRL
jgi:hypothetical protein